MEMMTSALEDQIPDFSGRVLFVYLTGKESAEGLYIDSPQIQMIHGRVFLVGITPRTPKLSDSPFCIAWDRIDAYVVADSIDDFMDDTESSGE